LVIGNCIDQIHTPSRGQRIVIQLKYTNQSMDQSVNHLSFHNDDIVRCDAQSPVREVQKCQTMIYKKCLATCS